MRNFDCPETGEQCTDKRCSKELCCERERLHAKNTREAAAKGERIRRAKVREILGPCSRRDAADHHPGVSVPPMTPADFLEDVVTPNVGALCVDVGNLRFAVNAIITLDALTGIIHADLKNKGLETGDDDAFRDRLAVQHADYRILRDAAAALKHGYLERPKPRLPRLVKRAEEVTSRSAVWDEAVWDQAEWGTAIWIEAEEPEHARRADHLTRAVLDILSRLRSQMTRRQTGR